jgi:hypothetical protein
VDVKLIKIPKQNMSNSTTYASAISMSMWCTDQGLTNGKDYTWHIETQSKEIHFLFNDDQEAFSTMFAIKWI